MGLRRCLCHLVGCAARQWKGRVDRGGIETRLGGMNGSSFRLSVFFGQLALGVAAGFLFFALL